jgi:hypothetical protein
MRERPGGQGQLGREVVPAPINHQRPSTPVRRVPILCAGTVGVSEQQVAGACDALASGVLFVTSAPVRSPPEASWAMDPRRARGACRLPGLGASCEDEGEEGSDKV